MVRCSVASTWRQPAKGLYRHEDVGCALPLVLVILTLRLTWTYRQGLPCVGQQLHGLLVKADSGPLRVIRLRQQVENVLHGADELRAYCGKAPLLALPGFDVPFFSTRQIVWWLTASTRSSCTSRSAKSLTVHLAWPGGTGLQAKYLVS